MPVRTFLGGLATLGGVALLALAVPVVILLVGTPIVLAARLVLELVRLL